MLLGGLKEITLEEAKKLKTYHIAVVPGKKICPSCRIVISKKLKETMAEDKEESQDKSHNSEIDEIELSFQSDVSKEQLNSTLSEIGVSPLKTHAISSHSIVSYGKKKLKQAQNVLEQKHSHIQTKIAESLQVSKNSLENINKEESVSV